MPVSLVTGAAGFIGSHLTRELLVHGHRVVAVDNLSGGWVENVPARAAFVQHDLVADDTDDLLHTWKPDYVWHLAAYAAEGLSHWVREFNYQNNSVASAKLVSAAVKHGVEHFYFTSSMAVYGTQQPPFTELMRPAPEDPYGIAKWSVEQDLAAAHRMFGLDYTIFRPHNVYGPGQNLGDPYRNVVGIFMRQALAGHPLSVFGDGSQTRAFSYISDITTPMVEALTVDTSGLTFNIGGEEVVSVGQLASLVSELSGAVIDFLPPRWEVKHAFSDHTLARNLLNFRPRVDFRDGLSRMWRWAEQTGIKWSQTPTLEHDVELPVFWQSVNA